MDYNNLNKYQTQLTDELVNKLPKELYSQLLDYIENIDIINWLIQPKEIRGTIKDRPFIEDSKKREIDITKPHILENMDYFRERAIFFENNGRYTNIPPNGNPKSEYAEFWREEKRRWKEGLIRKDGEWISGLLYFYWNYSPIWLTEKENDKKISLDDWIEKIINPINKKTKNKSKGNRKRAFPKPWLGDYLFYHYIDQAMNNGQHAKLFKCRGIGFSFKLSSISPCFMYTKPGSGNPNFHLASDKTFLTGDKGVYGKVVDVLDWLGEHTPMPKMRLIDSLQQMVIQIGYKDEYGTRKGLMSSVYGISLKDNPDKARGIRGPLIHYEEDGLFPNLEKAWNVNRKAVEDGDVVYGLMVAGGTGGVTGASFEGSEKLFYGPGAYNIYAIPNAYDKNTKSKTQCGFFWGAYMNRNECYDLKTGEPDVIKALLEILANRKFIKDSSSDPMALAQAMAEECITPQEAIMRTEGTIFPVADLKDVLSDILPNLKEFVSQHFTGRLVIKNDSSLELDQFADLSPVREYPIRDNKNKVGCIEIFQKPIKNGENQIPRGRYIAGLDPFDDDESTTDSLGCLMIMDSITEQIVAEYTGRPNTAVEFYENCRRLLLYYNAICNYENDKKGLFSYFDSKNALYLLCDNPQILKDMDMMKIGYTGNKAHPYSEKVYTPHGIKKWKDIKIGDKLFGSYGNITKVIDIPFDNVTEIYEITLRDGRKIKASKNHLWKVINQNDKEDVKTTEDLSKNYFRDRGKYKEYKYAIPKNDGVQYNYQSTDIEPYFLGLMLGDGCFTQSKHHQAELVSSIKDIETYKRYLSYEIKTRDDRHHRIVIKNIGINLKKLNLHDKKSRTKFIPDIYKYNSKAVRLEILKGLMDTDGTVSYGGNPSFTSISKQLANDVLEIGRSLGINGNMLIRENKFGKIYQIRFYTDIKLFKLERKYSKQKITKKRYRKTNIINIKKIGIEQAKCITVDSKDGCYLINDFVVTHNSKGTNSGKNINRWGRRLQADWLVKQAYSVDTKDNERLNMHTIRSIAYLKELIAWNININADRVSAMGMLMILKEDRAKIQVDITSKRDKTLANDEFWNKHFNQYNNKKSNLILAIKNKKI